MPKILKAILGYLGLSIQNISGPAVGGAQDFVKLVCSDAPPVGGDAEHSFF